MLEESKKRNDQGEANGGGRNADGESSSSVRRGRRSLTDLRRGNGQDCHYQSQQEGLQHANMRHFSRRKEKRSLVD
ncbi:hypothetical protein V6N13_140911 [Hibiscus sabdariffa]